MYVTLGCGMTVRPASILEGDNSPIGTLPESPEASFSKIPSVACACACDSVSTLWNATGEEEAIQVRHTYNVIQQTRGPERHHLSECNLASDYVRPLLVADDSHPMSLRVEVVREDGVHISGSVQMLYVANVSPCLTCIIKR